LLFDLLTPEEERQDRWTGELRFDVLLLARRLALATRFVSDQGETQSLRIGYFGASTGAAAALIAAATLPRLVGAVVSRGGRPDLASDALEQVLAPTLLIVGGEDRDVIELNRQAYARLDCEKRLEVIPGATHLFEEPGALEAVARLATAWFRRHLVEARQVDSETNEGDRR
jgi:dienelactone hydrolase